MPVLIQQFEQWLRSKEKEHLEFKEAKQQYDLDKFKNIVMQLQMSAAVI